jgi:hypothetical protein
MEAIAAGYARAAQASSKTRLRAVRRRRQSGFIKGNVARRRAVVYDEVAQLDDYEGVEITPLTREIAPENAFALNLMRITVDGKPLDDKDRSSADIQRCTDVALQEADIQFGFDDLEADRRLSVAADPATVEFYRSGGGWAAEPVRFRMYANYSHFIDRAEVRIFAPEQSLEAEPLARVAFGPDGAGEWLPEPEMFVAPARELKYVLRAYGGGGSSTRRCRSRCGSSRIAGPARPLTEPRRRSGRVRLLATTAPYASGAFPAEFPRSRRRAGGAAMACAGVRRTSRLRNISSRAVRSPC